jgi:hypothetical protein
MKHFDTVQDSENTILKVRSSENYHWELDCHWIANITLGWKG